MKPLRRLLFLSSVLALGVSLASSAWTQSAGSTAKPGATPAPAWAVKPWAGKRWAVAAAHPLAVDAGYGILRAGGSAVDAAIAVQMVLTLVEPQSSGIGGGAFMLHHDGKLTEAYDGRETAPATADEDLFLDAERKPLSFTQAAIGGRAVGAPGVLRMLELAHKQHGKLPWKRLFEPAIALAEHGFPVSPRLARLLAEQNALKQDPVAAAYFYDGAGKPWPAGHMLRNPELAAVLRRVAEVGAKAMHEGEIAEAIVRKVREHPRNPGRLTLDDLSGYEAKLRRPLCFVYTAPARSRKEPARDVQICGMPPPSSGVLAVGQILGILAHTPAAKLPPKNFRPKNPPPGLKSGPVPSADWLHYYAEASRLAMADRALYVADPDYVPAPGPDWTSLLDSAYLAERAKLIESGSKAKRMKEAPSGIPPSVHENQPRQSLVPMPDQPEYGTSHFSIVDGRGNALSMTSSIEAVWGAQIMVNRGAGLVGGFLLNNQLTDFSFTARSDGVEASIANRVEPGKRPRSSMTPLLVFDRPRGELLLSGGSPGGSHIIHYTGKLLYGVLHWGLDVQQAINLPNVAAYNQGPVMLETGRFPNDTIKALQQRGHAVQEVLLPSGLQALQATSSGLQGGADPRREGTVRGE